MLDAFVCTNLVNYTVARYGLLADETRRAFVFYERWRFQPQPRRGVWHLPISVWSMRLLRWLVAIGLIDMLYLPHQRLNRRAMAAARAAPRLAFLDDGLDTCRRRPQNFDVDSITGRPGYHTFRDYAQLPPWLAAFDVKRVCELRELAAWNPRPAFDLKGVDHVLVEAPGLNVVGLIEGLGLPVQGTLVVRHPVPKKRGSVPPGFVTVEGKEGNLEATLLAARGKSFYLGETMAMVFAALSGSLSHNRVFVQMSPAQFDNLFGLNWRPMAAGQPPSAQLMQLL